MSDYTDCQLEEIIANLKTKQKQILEAMLEYPLQIDSGIWILSDPPQKLAVNYNTRWMITRVSNILEELQNKGLVTFQCNQYSLTDLGKNILAQFKNYNNSKGNNSKGNIWDAQREKKLKTSDEFLELSKQGLSYQEIGDKYKISRERVRQIISINPDFESYKLKQEEEKLKLEEEKIASEKLKEEQAKQDLYERSIGFLYPERVAELWDYEKNGDLNPDELLSRTSSVEIWLKCPVDGYSWKKKPTDIVTIWKRNGKSGCPLCAGKTKKLQKQPSLIEAYPNFVQKYWNYEKNQQLKLNPNELTCGSGKKVWFKCSYDGNEWEKQIAMTVNQQWSQGNAGCCVCNGTENRKQGQWKRRQSIIIEFPDEVAKYWFYEANNELGLDPTKLTARSSKEAFFKCPVDGYEWVTTITSIAGSSWNNGNSGCPACRGLVAAESTCLLTLYPDFIRQYWDYEKNSQLGLYPDKLTRGSQKEGWFKCSIDDYEWKTKIGSITKASWDRGNSGCPACRGRVATENTSLISLYPEYIKQYWDYEKNSQLGIFPEEVTKGSQKEAWFKCSIDGYEWKTRIGSIARCSWKLGNNGCPKCGSGWTLEAIRQFVASLEEHIPHLTPAERYKIFEQSGVLSTQNKENLKVVKDIIKGKLSGAKLGGFLKGEDNKNLETELDNNDNLNANDELKVIDGDTSKHTFYNNNESIDDDLDSKEEKNNLNNLPKIRIQKSLEFLNSQVVASADQEAVEFFIASRRNRIWAEIFENESAIEALEEFMDEGYGRRVRDEFLDEYYQAKNMKIPSGWSFHLNGKIIPPNLMQKVSAVRLRNQKRILNLSLTGTGKTIGGILSSRIINAHLTVIICPLDTIKNWQSEIENVFSDSKITTHKFNPYWDNIEDGHHYIILNHEKFQQLSTASNIRQLLECFPIDLIIVDEIHKCKQRSENQSKRRQMVMGLITNAAEINPNLHVLGMSATPIINNLREGKSLVELVSGLERSDLGEMATTNNCMKLHQAFATLGIRSKVKPKIKVDHISIRVDCSELIDEIREKGTSVLKMEQILTNARIPTILKELRPKTIVYTHYVEGITNQLKEAIEAEGWTVGFHLGGNKSGFNEFINGSTDILIASSAMSVGVDGFQKVCNHLILNVPPWTSAELEQLEGRLNRQGQFSDTLTIIMPVTYGYDNGEYWSWDEGRLARLENKQTIADAAVDGIIPEGQLRNESQAFRDLRQWLERLKTGEQKPIIRPKIFVPLPDDDPLEVKRRYACYGNFSAMNARWNSSYSQTTYKRLQENPEEWMQYHTLYQEARKTWEIIPYQETIKWLKQRSGLVVADFGCGEAFIAKELREQHTIHSFDFIAINDSVTECDMAKVPLEDNCLDLAIFNLSLMGLNMTQYIYEAARTLHLDGQLWIYEVSSHIKNLQDFIAILKQAGFSLIKNVENSKFVHIWAIKSSEVQNIQLKFNI